MMMNSVGRLVGWLLAFNTLCVYGWCVFCIIIIIFGPWRSPVAGGNLIRRPAELIRALCSYNIYAGAESEPREIALDVKYLKRRRRALRK